MRCFSSELGHNYDSYTFGYANYCELEQGDSLEELYARGFLPYSGSPDVSSTLYMARSARVSLPDFQLTSENRRVAKKFDGRFQKSRTPVRVFHADEAFVTFCLDYFKVRHGETTMPRKRLEYILHSPFISHVITYFDADKPVAYVFEMRDGSAGHYWYSFYDISLVQQSLGLWLMLDSVRDAKESGLEQYYLGTVYGEKALYKTNFEPLQWWDGERWQRDVKMLRERGRSDKARTTPLADAWKDGQRPF